MAGSSRVIEIQKLHEKSSLTSLYRSTFEISQFPLRVLVSVLRAQSGLLQDFCSNKASDYYLTLYTCQGELIYTTIGSACRYTIKMFYVNRQHLLISDAILLHEGESTFIVSQDLIPTTYFCEFGRLMAKVYFAKTKLLRILFTFKNGRHFLCTQL